ncbi:transposase IS21 family (partial) [Herminiimonas arsenicoxydans]|uniref:Transposase IS21 family (Partial) n=1 Tax=Herminiimonas arsenicoxydans TaxID=204773 RepID=A4G831_HERAR|nr:transposase IS21 family (partial) [Herminiimonas arsenicoxydans]
MKQIPINLCALGYEGAAYNRVAAFARQWKVDQSVEIHLSLKSVLPRINELATPYSFKFEPNIHLSLNFYGLRSFISELSEHLITLVRIISFIKNRS